MSFLADLPIELWLDGERTTTLQDALFSACIKAYHLSINSSNKETGGVHGYCSKCHAALETSLYRTCDQCRATDKAARRAREERHRQQQ